MGNDRTHDSEAGGSPQGPVTGDTGHQSSPAPSDAWRSALSGNLPKWWVGLLFAAAVLLCTLLWGILESVAEEMGRRTPSGMRDLMDMAEMLAKMLSATGGFYWLYCIYRLHWAMAQATDGLYPITGFSAVIGHFIPFYNLYWVFKWPSQIAAAVNPRLASGHIPRALPGLLTLAGMLARGMVGGGLGLGILFAMGVYLNRRIAATLRPAAGRSADAHPNWS